MVNNLPIAEYYVLDENTFVYRHKDWSESQGYGVLSALISMGSSCKAGMNLIIVGSTLQLLRRATKEDFGTFRLQVPPDFTD